MTSTLLYLHILLITFIFKCYYHNSYILHLLRNRYSSLPVCCCNMICLYYFYLKRNCAIITAGYPKV